MTDLTVSGSGTFQYGRTLSFVGQGSKTLSSPFIFFSINAVILLLLINVV